MNGTPLLNTGWGRGLAWSALGLGVLVLGLVLGPGSGKRPGKGPDAEDQQRQRAYPPILRAARVAMKDESSPHGYALQACMLQAPPPPPPGGPIEGQEQMLVRSGQVKLEVVEVERALDELARIAKGAGGYVAGTERERRPSGALQGAAVLRIPADRIGPVGKAAFALGKVLSESSQVEDVTKEFADLESKLAVRQQAAARVRELLRQQTGNLKEVLEAEKELTRLQEEIEGFEGERRFTRHQVRFVTLRVSVEEPETLSLTRASSWSVLREAVAGAALLLAESLATLLRVLLALLPWALVIALAAWLVRLRRRSTVPESAS